jgi:hypothetical protein
LWTFVQWYLHRSGMNRTPLFLPKSVATQ